MKRFLSLILVVFLAVGLLAACGKDSSDSGSTGSNASNGSTDAPQGDDSIFSTEDVKFADDNNESVYRIVRPDGDAEVTAVAQSLLKQMGSLSIVGVKS